MAYHQPSKGSSIGTLAHLLGRDDAMMDLPSKLLLSVPGSLQCCLSGIDDM